MIALLFSRCITISSQEIVPLFPMNLEHIRTHYLQSQINKGTLKPVMPKPKYNKLKEVQY